MGSICLLSDGGLPSVSCVTHYSLVRSLCRAAARGGGAYGASTLASMAALKPNVVIYLIDDMDLERVPFYPRLDRGAAAQLEVHRRGNACRKGLANCTYTAPNIESIGERGVRFLGAHVPVSVCTPSRYALLTGRLPSSAPFYSGTHTGHFDAEGTVDISWNTYITQGAGPPCSRQRTRGCERRAQTLGDMLHRASYFTGFVGKWHVSSPAPGVQAYFRGSHGRIGLEPNTTAEEGAAAAELQRGYTEARKELHADVERSGFNYSGALSVGNVVDLAPLGLALHNVEWETEAALAFLRLGALHVKQGRAAAFYLHLCTTLTHSPGPRSGVCADPRLSAAGLSAVAPQVQPTRASVMARTGADGGGGDRYAADGADRWRCGWEEYDAAHTLWLDDAVGAVLAELRALRAERDTLFVVLADHQRLGKGTLYQGVRTPQVLQWPNPSPSPSPNANPNPSPSPSPNPNPQSQVLQWPAAVRGGLVLPPNWLVSSLDLAATILDAAGLTPPGAPPLRNAGGALDGRSLLPLFDAAAGGDAAGGAADAGAAGAAGGAAAAAETAAAGTAGAAGAEGAAPPSWWRSSLWFELGVAGALKHAGGWQIIATHYADEMKVPGPDGTARAAEAIACEHERIEVPPPPPAEPAAAAAAAPAAARWTHTVECVWRSSRAPLTLNLLGTTHVRFESEQHYPHYHSAEQLLHWQSDLLSQHDWRRRCPRQLRCMQRLLRAAAVSRTHFDGDPVPFGVYTAPPAVWANFSSLHDAISGDELEGECPASLLALPPERCNDGVPPARSALSCAELRAAPAALLKPEDPPPEEDVEPHAPVACAEEGGSCFVSRCCVSDATSPPLRCYGTLFDTATCKRSCGVDDTWTCTVLHGPPPPPPAAPRAPYAGAARGRPRWAAGGDGGGVCAESEVGLVVGVATTGPAGGGAYPAGAGGAGGGASCVGALVQHDAAAVCAALGARLCTEVELRADVAAGSGCDLDLERA